MITKDKSMSVLVSGCFSVLHAGHVELLEFASQFGSVTVGLNSDNYMKKKYGDKFVPLLNRAYCLRSNRFVDKVVVFLEDEPSRLIYKLRPDYYVRGPDYLGKDLPELDAIKDVGAKLVIHHAKKIHNASDLMPSMAASSFEQLPWLSEGVVDLESPVEPLGELFSSTLGDFKF